MTWAAVLQTPKVSLSLVIVIQVALRFLTEWVFLLFLFREEKAGQF